MISVEDIMQSFPCSDYPKGRVEALVGDGVTVAQLRELPIPTKDQYWVLAQTLPHTKREALIFDILKATDVATWRRGDRVEELIDYAAAWTVGSIAVSGLKLSWEQLCDMAQRYHQCGAAQKEKC